MVDGIGGGVISLFDSNCSLICFPIFKDVPSPKPAFINAAPVPLSFSAALSITSKERSNE